MTHRLAQCACSALACGLFLVFLPVLLARLRGVPDHFADPRRQDDYASYKMTLTTPVYVGYPVRSLSYEKIFVARWERDGRSAAWVPSDSLIAYGLQGHWQGRPTVIPLLPTSFGLVLGAGGAVIGWSLPHAARWAVGRVRQRQSRCPSCGYPAVVGTTRCSECGDCAR